MSIKTHIFGFRLSVAGLALLFLLAWPAIVPDALPPLVAKPGYSPHPFAVFGTVAISVFILAILLPMAFRGTRKERVLSLLFSLIPSLVLVYTLIYSFEL